RRTSATVRGRLIRAPVVVVPRGPTNRKAVQVGMPPAYPDLGTTGALFLHLVGLRRSLVRTWGNLASTGLWLDHRRADRRMPSAPVRRPFLPRLFVAAANSVETVSKAFSTRFAEVRSFGIGVCVGEVPQCRSVERVCFFLGEISTETRRPEIITPFD